MAPTLRLLLAAALSALFATAWGKDQAQDSHSRAPKDILDTSSTRGNGDVTWTPWQPPAAPVAAMAGWPGPDQAPTSGRSGSEPNLHRHERRFFGVLGRAFFGSLTGRAAFRGFFRGGGGPLLRTYGRTLFRGPGRAAVRTSLRGHARRAHLGRAGIRRARRGKKEAGPVASEALVSRPANIPVAWRPGSTAAAQWQPQSGKLRPVDKASLAVDAAFLADALSGLARKEKPSSGPVSGKQESAPPDCISYNAESGWFYHRTVGWFAPSTAIAEASGAQYNRAVGWYTLPSDMDKTVPAQDGSVGNSSSSASDIG